LAGSPAAAPASRSGRNKRRALAAASVTEGAFGRPFHFGSRDTIADFTPGFGDDLLDFHDVLQGSVPVTPNPTDFDSVVFDTLQGADELQLSDLIANDNLIL